MDNARVLIAGELSEWLHKLRLQAGLTINEAAKRAECSELSILNWETGFPISVADLLILGKIYGIKEEAVIRKIKTLSQKVPT